MCLRRYSDLMGKFLALFLAVALHAQTSGSIAAKTAGMQRLGGYFPLYWDARSGKMWLEVDRFEQEFLYLSGLSAGVGSNDLGLDRGQSGESRVVRFERSGPKVLLVHRPTMRSGFGILTV